ncbi:hypothetical protein MLD38_030976 [Melastoma candidum]|uniref:Uncharacterized protein n=1 Tax=Melastoma candidum TaxID=119954 RepID=A0ACB9MQ86_9MYRT|nr:hypothetical protein MLD38_030976 [Melastoma candidum]
MLHDGAAEDGKMNFEDNQFHQFEHGISAALDLVYETQIELVAGFVHSNGWIGEILPAFGMVWSRASSEGFAKQGSAIRTDDTITKAQLKQTMKESVEDRCLGLTPSATKDEIKEAFCYLAVKYHPDKHSLSSQSVSDDATLRFKPVSEAYDVLMDDRKHAEYNIRHSRGCTGGRNYYVNSGYHKGGGRSEYPPRGFAYRFEIVMWYMTTRAFLLNATFASSGISADGLAYALFRVLSSALLGAAVVIDRGWDTLWKTQNSGVHS